MLSSEHMQTCCLLITSGYLAVEGHDLPWMLAAAWTFLRSCAGKTHQYEIRDKLFRVSPLGGFNSPEVTK